MNVGKTQTSFHSQPQISDERQIRLNKTRHRIDKTSTEGGLSLTMFRFMSDPLLCTHHSSLRPLRQIPRSTFSKRRKQRQLFSVWSIVCFLLCIYVFLLFWNKDGPHNSINVSVCTALHRDLIKTLRWLQVCPSLFSVYTRSAVRILRSYRVMKLPCVLKVLQR